MPELSELSDWIWYVVVGLWVATRVLPRVFGSRGSRGSGRARTPAQPRPGRAARQQQSMLGPKAPELRSDAEAQKRIRSAAPIEPS